MTHSYISSHTHTITYSYISSHTHTRHHILIHIFTHTHTITYSYISSHTHTNINVWIAKSSLHNKPVFVHPYPRCTHFVLGNMSWRKRICMPSLSKNVIYTRAWPRERQIKAKHRSEETEERVCVSVCMCVCVCVCVCMCVCVCVRLRESWNRGKGRYSIVRSFFYREHRLSVKCVRAPSLHANVFSFFCSFDCIQRNPGYDYRRQPHVAVDPQEGG